MKRFNYTIFRKSFSDDDELRQDIKVRNLDFKQMENVLLPIKNLVEIRL